MNRTGRPVAVPLLAAVAVLCLVGAVVAFVLPMEVHTRLIEGVALPCGSLLDPGGSGSTYSYYCDGAQSGRILLVNGLLVLAVVLGATSFVLGATDRSGAWRVVRWSVWPVSYLLTVVGVWVVTYPYVQTRDGVSGLEFVLQMFVATPLGWFTPSAGTPGQDSVVLLAAGLVQVALVAAFCRWGYVGSRNRARDVREEPTTPAPVT